MPNELYAFAAGFALAAALAAAFAYWQRSIYREQLDRSEGRAVEANNRYFFSKGLPLVGADIPALNAKREDEKKARREQARPHPPPDPTAAFRAAVMGEDEKEGRSRAS